MNIPPLRIEVFLGEERLTQEFVHAASGITHLFKEPIYLISPHGTVYGYEVRPITDPEEARKIQEMP